MKSGKLTKQRPVQKQNPSGTVWTPLIASTFPAKKVVTFGSDVPMKRGGEPAEIAPCYVFLACEDSSNMTGQVLHPNGGEIVNT